MKKIIALGLLLCLVALPLAACTGTTPSTTTTTRTTTVTTTAATTVSSTAPAASEGASEPAVGDQMGNMTRYLHGMIDEVTDSGLTLSEVPVYGSCEIEVDDSTQLVGVSDISELEQGLHVIVGYADTQNGLLPDNGSLVEGVSEAASEIMTLLPDASDIADAVEGGDSSPMPSATPDGSTQASPAVTPGMGGEKLVAVTVELAEPLPKLTGNVTETKADGFVMEGTAEGTVHVVAPEGTLMEGVEKPAVGDTVTVVYNGQIGKANPGRVTAVSVTREEKTAK